VLSCSLAEGGDAVSYSTGIWSLRWSSDNSEIVAGTGDNSLYVYDVTQVGGWERLLSNTCWQCDLGG